MPDRSILHKLNPFARLPNPREVWAWGMYDLANQSFQLLINTLLFSIFVREVVVVNDTAKGERLWTAMFAGSLVLVSLLSPITGALADQRAWKKELLLTSGLICAVLTMGLALLGAGHVWAAVLMYVIAAVACGLGENFLGSFLPEISTPRNVGYVSALGWTMSYIGALLLIGILAVFAFVLDRSEPGQARPMFVFAGAWFIAGMTPAMIFLREKATPAPAMSGRTIIGASFGRLWRTAKESRRYRQLVRFFISFFVQSMGVLAVVGFLGVIGKKMGFGLGELSVFALVISVTAGLSSALTARFQDRVGHMRTVRFFLLMWMAATGILAGLQFVRGAGWAFWLISVAIGIGLGGIGTASRAVVGAFTPESKAGEFFGMWGMIYKLGGVVGAGAFGLVSSSMVGSAEGGAGNGAMGQALGLLLLTGFFGIAFALLARVDEAEGIRVAEAESGPAAQDLFESVPVEHD